VDCYFYSLKNCLIDTTSFRLCYNSHKYTSNQDLRRPPPASWAIVVDGSWPRCYLRYHHTIITLLLYQWSAFVVSSRKTKMACVLMGIFLDLGRTPNPISYTTRGSTELTAHCTGDYRKQLLTQFFPKVLPGLSKQPIHPDIIPPCLRWAPFQHHPLAEPAPSEPPSFLLISLMIVFTVRCMPSISVCDFPPGRDLSA
jgi:hypothetical protein